MELYNVELMTPWFRHQLDLPADRILRLDLSQREHTPMGFVVHDLHYRYHLRRHFGNDIYMGYPHAGGYHKVYFPVTASSALEFVAKMRVEVSFSRMAREGLNDFLDLMTRRIYEIAF